VQIVSKIHIQLRTNLWRAWRYQRGNHNP